MDDDNYYDYENDEDDEEEDNNIIVEDDDENDDEEEEEELNNKEDENYVNDDEDYIVNIDKNKYADIYKYKKMNIEALSTNAIISFIANVVEAIKTGKRMLDGRTDYEYGNETEESTAITAILTRTTPFEYIVNLKKIDYDFNSLIICIKNVICHESNKDTKPIYLTPRFLKDFPILCSNLYTNKVTKEELKEIEKVRERNLNNT